jgi:hypothetical protein
MQSFRLAKAVLVPLALATLAACASSGEEDAFGETPGGEGLTIQVRNDVIPPSGIVVWAVPETGIRTRLGPVPPNARRSFKYSPPLRAMEIYLVAETEGPISGTMGQARERRSNPFNTLDIQSVIWTVSRPNIQVGGG